MLKSQRNSIYEKIQTLSGAGMVFHGLPVSAFRNGVGLLVEDIPGVKEAGWTPPSRAARIQAESLTSPLTQLEAKFLQVLKLVTRFKESKPFHAPVDTKQVRDYLSVIKEPMDLSTVEKRVKDHYYRTTDAFRGDMMLIFNNCRTYNEPNTEFYRAADNSEQQYHEIMKKVGLE